VVKRETCRRRLVRAYPARPNYKKRKTNKRNKSTHQKRKAVALLSDPIRTLNKQKIQYSQNKKNQYKKVMPARKIS
jgi:hypothetical protein